MQDSTLRWMDRAARVGFLAKGVVYAIVGAYALERAVGRGGAFLDKEAVAEKVVILPFGRVLLAALGIGLLCYAAWRFVQAAVDPRGEAHGLKGVARRIGRAGSGAIHAFLGVSVLQALTGADDDRQAWVAQVVARPGGRWLLVGAGLGVIAVGLYQWWRAFSASFARKLDGAEMSADERTWALRVGRLGMIARGVVFPLIGWFLLHAGLDTDPSQARGTGGALREIATAPMGPVLLAIVASGLIAYAALMVLNARYRRWFA
jgi:uncharacterized membrane protein YidH (DUF202 family)